MRRRRDHLLFKNLDWWSIATYLLLVFIGWVSIFSAVYDPEHSHIFDTSQRYGMQNDFGCSEAWFASVCLYYSFRHVRMYFYSNLIYFIGIFAAGCGALFRRRAEWVPLLACIGPHPFSTGRNVQVVCGYWLGGSHEPPPIFHIQKQEGFFCKRLFLILFSHGTHLSAKRSGPGRCADGICCSAL